jgi:hypothetical protein
VIGALRSAPLSDIAALSSGRPATASVSNGESAAVIGRPKRKMTNYPKCKWGGCGKNMSPRTRPYCGEHFRRVRAGENPPALVDAAAAAAAAEPKKRGRKPKRR